MSYAAAISPEVRMINIDALRAGANPFGATRTENVKDIVLSSVEDVANLPPLDAKENEGVFDVFVGNRRLQAAKDAAFTNGWPDVNVPVRVWPSDTTEIDMAKMAIVENVSRRQPSIFEEAKAFAKLVDLGMSKKEAAAEFLDEKGKPRPSSYGTMLAVLALSIETYPQLQATLAKLDLGLRTVYEILSEVPAEKEALKEINDRLKANDETLLNTERRRTAMANGESEEINGGDEPEPKKRKKKKSGKKAAISDEPKLLSGKSIVSIIDEAQTFMKETELDTTHKDDVKRFLKVLTLVLTGKLDGAALVKKLRPTA